MVLNSRNLTFSCAPLVDIRCVKETFEGAFQEGDLLHHMARAFSMSPSTYYIHTGLQTRFSRVKAVQRPTTPYTLAPKKIVKTHHAF